MLDRRIQQLIPRAEDLLGMSSEQLAPILLKLARDKRQQAGFIPDSVSGFVVSEGYPSSKMGEVQTHLTRAWNWIARKGLIEPSPGFNGQNGWRMFTKEGEAVADGANIEATLVAHEFPRALLHQAIIDNCEGLFSSGHYPQAVESSFKVVRERLRQLTGFERGSEAFGKGNLRLKGAMAPHVHDDFNEGVKFLTMAIDRFRNEKSHAVESGVDDPRKALQYLILSSLAMRLLDGAEVP